MEITLSVFDIDFGLSKVVINTIYILDKFWSDKRNMK